MTIVPADILRTSVANGSERHGRARAPFGKANIEILVTDLNMPGMDGYELAQRAAAPGPDRK
jgi:CheY-like chemotaxis protein